MKDTWEDDRHVAEVALNARVWPELRKRAAEGERPRFSLQHGIHPNGFAATFTWRDHSDILEREFPGCSVTWDHHRELSTWGRYWLLIAFNYVATRPKGYRGIPDDMLAHRRHRRQRELMLDEARKIGAFMLVAYPLQPPTWKPGMIAVEHDVDAEVWGDTTPHRYQSLVPIRAIYSAAECRWTVVR